MLSSTLQAPPTSLFGDLINQLDLQDPLIMLAHGKKCRFLAAIELIIGHLNPITDSQKSI